VTESLHYVFYFVLAATLSIIVTPWIMKLAGKIGAIDKPDERKIHARPMPRLGGVGIFISVALTLAVAITFDPMGMELFTGKGYNLYLLGLAFLLVLALGIWDDMKQLKPGPKFIVQTFVATLVYFAGFRLDAVGHPLGTGMVGLGLFEFPATVIWIVGVTNALNLIDGLDGLAAGVATISSLTIFAISLSFGNSNAAFASLLIAGAAAGFLRYNFHPAKIFLGDSGSLFLGLSLATFSMHTSAKISTVYTLLVPVFALGLPLLDTGLSMLRRFLSPFLPNTWDGDVNLGMFKSIFMPDRRHIHHQLMAKGYSHRKVVLLLYSISLALGVGAFLISLADTLPMIMGILLMVGAAMYFGLRHLSYGEMAIHRNGILLGLYIHVYKWPIIKRAWFQSILDTFFATASLTIAFALAAPALLANRPEFGTLAAAAIAIQIVVFWVSGLYKQTTRQLGTGDALRTLRCLIIAAIATIAVIDVLAVLPFTGALTIGILDLFFLLSMVGVSRFSFSMLTHLLHRDTAGKRTALIYGADHRGSLAVQALLNSDAMQLAPVGFLDSDPELEGKILNGYPILGTHWKLPQILQKMNIDEIVVPSGDLDTEVMAQIQAVARAHNLPVHRLDWQLSEFTVQTKGKEQLRREFYLAKNEGVPAQSKNSQPKK
jgi:UDP-GlcNAc:undecaprenyl-phosphate GlcNAc-1-phosphate transferase